MKRRGIVVGIVLAIAAQAALAASESGSLTAETLVFRNLIGRIEVVGHGGTEFEISLDLQGRDADTVRIEVSEGRTAEWRVVFPESRRYVYPPMGNRETHIHQGDGSWLARLFGGSRIEVSGRGRGLEVWADATIRVPRGKTLKLDHGVGDIEARDLEGEIVLSSRSGTIDVLRADGEITADTGSGRVSLEDVRGRILADTGSGSVTVKGCHGEKLNVDTGSGRVELDGIDVDDLVVDTGSGRVEALRVSAASALIDTGSGSVLLQLDRMGDGRFEIDTGSGSIDLVLPYDASAEVDADTGAGGVRIDLAGDHSIRHKEKNEASVRIGGGAARVTLDTGSGGIRISQDG